MEDVYNQTTISMAVNMRMNIDLNSSAISTIRIITYQLSFGKVDQYTHPQQLQLLALLHYLAAVFPLQILDLATDVELAAVIFAAAIAEPGTTMSTQLS